jgi:hypothetical protein
LHDGDSKQKHHRGAVHGENLVVEIGAEETTLWTGELQSHQQRQDAAQQEEEKRRDDESFADRPMVGIAEPAPQARWGSPGLL